MEKMTVATKKGRQIRASLIAQLRNKGAEADHFVALIDDYVNYYETVQKMKKNIRKNGITYAAISAAGKEYEKDNPCVKQLPQYTRAMLAILKELGLTTDNVGAEDEEL